MHTDKSFWILMLLTWVLINMNGQAAKRLRILSNGLLPYIQEKAPNLTQRTLYKIMKKQYTQLSHTGKRDYVLSGFAELNAYEQARKT